MSDIKKQQFNIKVNSVQYDIIKKIAYLNDISDAEVIRSGVMTLFLVLIASDPEIIKSFPEDVLDEFASIIDINLISVSPEANASDIFGSKLIEGSSLFLKILSKNMFSGAKAMSMDAKKDYNLVIDNVVYPILSTEPEALSIEEVMKRYRIMQSNINELLYGFNKLGVQLKDFQKSIDNIDTTKSALDESIGIFNKILSNTLTV